MDYRRELHELVLRSIPDATAYRNARNVTIAFIGLNTAVFGAWQYALQPKQWRLNRELVKHFMLSWDAIKAGRKYTMITSAFSHKDLRHFALNMYGFYNLGLGLAQCPGIGGVGMVALALGSGLAGSFAWLYHRKLASMQKSRAVKRGNIHTLNDIQHSSGIVLCYQALGASGIVSGLSAAATCLYPNALVRISWIPIPIPQWLASVVYFLVDTYGLNNGVSNIGHAAVSSRRETSLLPPELTQCHSMLEDSSMVWCITSCFEEV